MISPNDKFEIIYYPGVLLHIFQYKLRIILKKKEEKLPCRGYVLTAGPVWIVLHVI